MTPTAWLTAIATAIRYELPDADVDEVRAETLTIVRGRAALAIAAHSAGAVVFCSLARDDQGPWSANAISLSQALRFAIAPATLVRAAKTVTELLR